MGGKNDGVEAVSCANTDGVGTDSPFSYAASVDISCLIPDKNDGVEAIANGIGTNVPHSYAASVDISCLIPDKNDGVEVIANGDVADLSPYFVASVDIGCVIPDKNDLGVTGNGVGPDLPHSEAAFSVDKNKATIDIPCDLPRAGSLMPDGGLVKVLEVGKLPRSGSFPLMPGDRGSANDSSMHGFSGDDMSNHDEPVGNFIPRDERGRNKPSSGQNCDA